MILWILTVIHTLIWCFILFGGCFSVTYAKINLLYVIPFVYLLHILPFHILTTLKVSNIKSTNPHITDEEIEKKMTDAFNIFILPSIKNTLVNFFSFSTFNPLSPQGMLILGGILNVYLLKYYWKKSL